MSALVSTYQWLKAVHVVFAVIWVGGAFMVQAFALRILPTGDGARIAAFAKDTEFLGLRIFTPASLILLGSGAWALHDSSGVYDYSQTWVQLGIVVIVLSIVVGAGFLGPESGRIARAIEAGGVASPEAQMRIRRIFVVARIELLLLLLIVVDMVVKPGI